MVFVNNFFLYLRIAMAMKILYRNKKKVTCKAEKKIGRIIDPIFQNFSKLHSKINLHDPVGTYSADSKRQIVQKNLWKQSKVYWDWKVLEQEKVLSKHW